MVGSSTDHLSRENELQRLINENKDAYCGRPEETPPPTAVAPKGPVEAPETSPPSVEAEAPHEAPEAPQVPTDHPWTIPCEHLHLAQPCCISLGGGCVNMLNTEFSMFHLPFPVRRTSSSCDGSCRSTNSAFSS